MKAAYTNLWTKAANTLLIGGFLLMMCLSLAESRLHLDPTPPPDENRTLNPWPAWPKNSAELFAWPQLAEAYFNDHFGWRSSLMTAYLNLKVEVLGESPSKIHILGKDSWTYLDNPPATDSYRKNRVLTDPILKRMKDKYESWRDYCHEHGAEFIATWGPDKSTIYPEYEPDWFHPVGTKSCLDYLSDYMARQSTVTLVDLRPTLLEAKKSGLIYYKADSHWNTVGGWKAYQTLSKAISEKVPSYHVLPESRIEFSIRPRKDTDSKAEIPLPRYIDVDIPEAAVRDPKAKFAAHTIPGLSPDNTTIIRIFESPDKTLPKAVIFHDSFNSAVRPFFIESFSRTVCVLDPGFPAEIIALEHPDIVIQLHVERSLAGGKVLGF